MKDAKLLKILVQERALIKLLKTLGMGKGYPTRELLTRLGAYGYGHKLLIIASKKGLVERKNVKNRVINTLSADGRKLVSIAKEIGV